MKNENILFFFHSELDLLDKFVLVGLAVLFLCILWENFTVSDGVIRFLCVVWGSRERRQLEISKYT